MDTIVRYADDAVIVCRTRRDTKTAYEHLKRIMARLKLTLNPQKTKIVDMNKESFDFLGFHYQKFHKTKNERKQKKYRGHVLGEFREWYAFSGIEHFYYLNKKRYKAVF